MGNAIKFLKKEISSLPDTLREEEVSGLMEAALWEGDEMRLGAGLQGSWRTWPPLSTAMA